MFVFTLKNLLRRKSRTILAVLGISIGITMIITLVSISHGFESQFEGILESFGSAEVLEKGAGDQTFSVLDLDLANNLKKINGIKVISPTIYAIPSTIEGKPAFGGIDSVSIVGADVPTWKQMKGGGFGIEVTKGRFLENNNEDGVVLGKVVADKNRKKINDKIEINGEEYKVIGIYDTGNSFFDNTMVMSIDTVREIAKLPSGKVNTFRVEAVNPDELNNIAKKIELTFNDVEAYTSEELLEQLSGVLDIISGATILISSVAALIGGIGVLNTMLMSVLERTKEIGILKAVGWKNKVILQMILLESLMISFFGLLFGAIFGGIIAFAIIPLSGLETALNMELIIYASTFSIILGLIGGLYPAYRASKMSPAEAFRND